MCPDADANLDVDGVSPSSDAALTDLATELSAAIQPSALLNGSADNLIRSHIALLQLPTTHLLSAIEAAILIPQADCNRLVLIRAAGCRCTLGSDAVRSATALVAIRLSTAHRAIIDGDQHVQKGVLSSRKSELALGR